jgi:hypothetical protein
LGRYLNLGGGATYFPQDMIHPINDRINVSLQRELGFRVLTDTTFFTNLGRNVQDATMWGGDYTSPVNNVDPNYAYTYRRRRGRHRAEPILQPASGRQGARLVAHAAEGHRQ